MLPALIASVLSGEASEWLLRSRRALMAYAVAALLAVIAVMFFVVAGFIALSERIGPVAAALWFGGVALVLAMLVVVVHRVAALVRARRIARKRRTEVTAVASAAAVAAVPSLLAGRGRAVLLLVPALASLGYVAARRWGPLNGRHKRIRRR